VTAFRLEVGADRLATLTFDAPDRAVNVFDRAALEELDALIAGLAGRGGEIGCLVLLSGKEKGFIAGADLDMIAGVTDRAEAEAGARFGQRLFAAWEALPFPTVAAIHGACMGGGTELALASTWRVASDAEGTRIGLPEVQLGILPGWGGCTRLPRLVALPAALDVILSGSPVRAKKALKIGLVDALVPAAGFLGRVRDFALGLDWERPRPKPGAGFKERLLSRNPVGRKLVFDQAKKSVLERTRGHYPAPLAALEVVRTGLERGRAAGFDAEARADADLAVSGIAKNLIHVYRLREAARKAAVEGAAPRPVRAAAVLGAGTMGGGIAQLIAHEARVPVRLKDIDAGALAAGMATAAGLFRKLVERRRLSRAESARRMALVSPTLDYAGFGRADLVIEAIVEKLAVKQKVFAEVAAAAPADAVLATNTSALSIDAIARDTPRPERVVGMHFFNPVHKMPLVEVIAGPRTSAEAVATVLAFTQRLGKVPVEVKEGPGFLVNRLLGFYSVEALWLLDEGYRIEDVDRALVDWGMPVGPIALGDEVGIDVATEVAHTLHAAFGDRLPLPPWIGATTGAGRLGAKSGGGFYRYDGRERKGPDPEVYALLGLEPRAGEADARLLVERTVLRMVDEAARCLDEGLVAGPGQVDLAMIMGTGFPPFRGGVCRWADSYGPARAVATLERFARTVGPRYEPGAALRRVAEAGGFYAAFGGG
jgi:3-hydroxyacyl-CoA dehydrogenase/enoyl-CoA hydratase/3-hydroxybutyryl-CoA epimerase